jgi:hypothetical protein
MHIRKLMRKLSRERHPIRAAKLSQEILAQVPKLVRSLEACRKQVRNLRDCEYD